MTQSFVVRYYFFPSLALSLLPFPFSTHPSLHPRSPFVSAPWPKAQPVISQHQLDARTHFSLALFPRPLSPFQPPIFTPPWPKAQPVISQHQMDARETALAGTNLDFASHYSNLRSLTLARTGSTATARFLASNHFCSSKSLARPSPSARSMKFFSSGSPAGGGSGGVESERVGTMSHRRGLGIKGSSFMGVGDSFQRSASRMGSFMGSKMGDGEERGSVSRSVTKSWRTFSIASAGAGAGGGGCVGADAAVAAVGDVAVGTRGGDSAVSNTGASGEKRWQRKAVSFLSDASDGAGDTAGGSTGRGEEKQRQKKAVSFFSDGDASDGGVVSAVSSSTGAGEVGGGEEKKQRTEGGEEKKTRKKKGVSFMSDGEASDGAGETAGSSTGQGKGLSQPQQQQKKKTVLTRNYSIERDGGTEKEKVLTINDILERDGGDTGDHDFSGLAPADLEQLKDLKHEDDADDEYDGGDIGQHGMVLPFDPLTLSFRNVNYYVDMLVELKDKAAPPS
ncbi:unnamed protein product [Closterium sp. NIES-54]